MYDKRISTLVLRKSGYAVNQEISLNERIKKKTTPFIEKHLSDGEYLFRPDLATSHYDEAVVDMDEK